MKSEFRSSSIDAIMRLVEKTASDKADVTGLDYDGEIMCIIAALCGYFHWVFPPNHILHQIWFQQKQ